MKIHRFVLSLAIPLAFSLAGASQASAEGACVFVKQEMLQCVEASSARSCSTQSPTGEFHAGTTCKNIGYGVTWGMAQPPTPPAKASFDDVSYDAGRQVPKIDSPMKKQKRPMRSQSPNRDRMRF